MAIWSGIGMNYGHQVSSTSYDTAQVESDFTFLKANGVTRLRIAFPGFDESSETIAHCQDMAVRALSHGFYVVWGVSTGYGTGTINATRWAASKAYILGTLVPWAKSVGLSELCLGNENELSDDGTTLTDAAMRADVRAMAASIKSNGFRGNLSYSTAILESYRDGWISEGIGDLDLIGWNSYDILSNFNIRSGVVQSAFGAKTYISEFGSINNGFPDFNDETAFYNDTASRIQSMQSAGIQAGYFFCYRDGASGVPANSFGLVGYVHLARNAVLGL